MAAKPHWEAELKTNVHLLFFSLENWKVFPSISKELSSKKVLLTGAYFSFPL